MPEIAELGIRFDESDILTVNRVDFLGQKVGNVKKTDEGYLQGEAPIAKIGILTYALADGTYRNELVMASTLFNQESMDSLKMKPMTNQHPPEILLDSVTVKRRKVGFTGENVKRNDSFLVTSLAITDSDAIKSIDNGTQELSPGYTCEVINKDGVFEGKRYDAIQIKRTYNHVAICNKARGGSDLKLNLDSESINHIDGFELTPKQLEIKVNKDREELNLINRKGQCMPQINIDGIDYNVEAKEVVNFCNKLVKKNTDSETTIVTLTTAKDDLQGKLDTANDEIKTLKDVNIDEKVKEGVKARIDLETKAARVLDKEIMEKIDTMTDLEVKKAVIVKKSPDAKATQKKLDAEEVTEVYIQARFDSVIELLPEKKEDKAINRQRRDATPRKDSTTDDDTGDTVGKARNDMVERMTHAHEDKKEEKK